MVGNPEDRFCYDAGKLIISCRPEQQQKYCFRTKQTIAIFATFLLHFLDAVLCAKTTLFKSGGDNSRCPSKGSFYSAHCKVSNHSEPHHEKTGLQGF